MALDSTSLAASLRCYDSNELIIGLRPEDLRWAREAHSESAVTLRGRAEIVEPLGSETLVTVVVNGNRLVSRFPPRSGIQTGDDVELALDPTHLHLFNPESGECLTADER